MSSFSGLPKGAATISRRRRPAASTCRSAVGIRRPAPCRCRRSSAAVARRRPRRRPLRGRDRSASSEAFFGPAFFFQSSSPCASNSSAGLPSLQGLAILLDALDRLVGFGSAEAAPQGQPPRPARGEAEAPSCHVHVLPGHLPPRRAGRQVTVASSVRVSPLLSVHDDDDLVALLPPLILKAR